ncbi:MAG TPA: SET domain-containing protein-lysine N-methyltransferase [Ilumatobacteraceae bacterium]
MGTNFLSPKAAIRSDATGWGSYAVDAIEAGETIAAFGGSCVSRHELDAMADGDRAHAIQIDDDLFLVSPITAVPPETVNHSCRPNCGLSGGTVVIAMRDIAAGEELAFDHAMSSGSDFNEFECQCGATSCRHKVTGSDWMLPELQIAYRGYFSPYLARRIAALVRTGAERRAFAL